MIMLVADAGIRRTDGGSETSGHAHRFGVGTDLGARCLRAAPAVPVPVQRSGQSPRFALSWMSSSSRRGDPVRGSQYVLGQILADRRWRPVMCSIMSAGSSCPRSQGRKLQTGGPAVGVRAQSGEILVAEASPPTSISRSRASCSSKGHAVTSTSMSPSSDHRAGLVGQTRLGPAGDEQPGGGEQRTP